MISLIAALWLAAASAEPAKPAPASDRPPASTANAVDANGVPAWAKRKRLHPVQNCTSRPNITVNTWREERDEKGQIRGVPIKTTCKP